MGAVDGKLKKTTMKGHGVQMDLFGGILMEDEPNPKKVAQSPTPFVEWSFSRRGTLETCPRKYYYQYYGGKQEKRGSPKEMDSIRFLKMLSNQHLVSGSIVHSLIRLFLTKAQEGTTYSLDFLKKMARDTVTNSITFTENYRQGDEKKNPYLHLLQEVFEERENSRAIYQQVIDKTSTLLDNFYQSEVFKPFVEAGKKLGAFAEKKFKLPLDEHTKVSGEADLAFWQDGYFVICDWKTGKVDDGDDSMQLLTYTWWAMDTQNVPLDKVKLYKAYLLENEVKEFRLSEREFYMNKIAIRQSADVMLEMAEFGEEGDWSAFTPCNQRKICSLCPFQKICQ